ncbi:unnamed protein product [Knipowitschia caucasica]|uniref:Ig-like domain-containing protein n=1 Tax=Knipowitschia caucasica TaxID=637954 RepID=A0AAV2LBG7_KNICA
MEGTAFMCLLSLSSGLIATNAESTADCTHYASMGSPFRLPLPLPRPKDHRLRWRNSDRQIIFDSKSRIQTKTSSGKIYSVTQEGALIFPKLDQSDGGTYSAETLNENGRETGSKSFSLCVRKRVLKPKVTFQCDSMLRQVQFNCSGSQVPPVTYVWLESGRLLPNENKPTLVRTSKSDVSNPFSCNVSNHVSSEISDPVQQNCLKPEDTNKLLGLEFWLMVAILAGGGGLVLVLIVATVICCSINRRKKKHHIKEEQELRLQWTTNNQQYHHSNQRGHAHSRDPTHLRDPAHSSRPLVNQGPGHTGPRVPKSRLNRPRPPDPITGQPLPGPRRQAEKGQMSEPTIGNDAESPPPLPKPRKNVSRS